MKKILLILLLSSGIGNSIADTITHNYSNLQAGIDSANRKMKDMDAQAANVQKGLDSIGEKLKEQQAKIDAAKNRPTNYWMPIVGGAILGIGLAVWLRSRKKG